MSGRSKGKSANKNPKSPRNDKPRKSAKATPKPVATDPAPELRLYGLLITKDDQEVFADWCRDQLHLYDAVVCLDGSESDATARLAALFPDRLIYLHERDFTIPKKTDHGLRGVAHREIIRRFGHGHWIMCCHTDEFCYHDPRQIALKAQKEGYDAVSWFSPHFYPHPDELPEWSRLRVLPVQERFRYYHWSYFGDGYPWLEDRLYQALPDVEWDDVTHGNVRPTGVKKVAPFHPIFRHFKVIATDPAWYEREPDCSKYKHHWQDQEHRTGLPFPVSRFEDLFVTQVRKYTQCDRFDSTFVQAWNMGEEHRCKPTPHSANGDPVQRHREASQLAIAGDTAEAYRRLVTLDADGTESHLRARVKNDLGALAAMRGDLDAARAGFQSALSIDCDCQSAVANLDQLGSPVAAVTTANPPGPSQSSGASKDVPIKVAIASFLFNWPSTGGGIVHTVELGQFLGKGATTYGISTCDTNRGVSAPSPSRCLS